MQLCVENYTEDSSTILNLPRFKVQETRARTLACAYYARQNHWHDALRMHFSSSVLGWLSLVKASLLVDDLVGVLSFVLTGVLQDILVLIQYRGTATFESKMNILPKKR